MYVCTHTHTNIVHAFPYLPGNDNGNCPRFACLLARDCVADRAVRLLLPPTYPRGPLAVMKCNGADSITTLCLLLLPDTIKSQQIPPEPTQHSLLLPCT